MFWEEKKSSYKGLGKSDWWKDFKKKLSHFKQLESYILEIKFKNKIQKVCLEPGGGEF